MARRDTKADSDQFDALADPPGLMVRSHDRRPTKISQRLCAASRTMGPPHPSRRALRDACVFRKRMYLRPPNTKVSTKFQVSVEMENTLSSAVGRRRRSATQDEADKRQHLVLPIHFQRDSLLALRV